MNVYDIKFKASTWMKQSNFRSIKELRQYTKKDVEESKALHMSQNDREIQ